MSDAPVSSTPIDLTLLAEPGWRTPAGSGPLGRLDAALLALLVLGGAQPRDRTAQWLWPRATLRHANLSLRQRLFKLRRDTRHPLVEAADTLRLAPGVVADVNATALPAQGELLAGFDYGDLEDFNAWLLPQREALLLRQLDARIAHSARLEAAGALAEAIRTCEDVLARRPAMEHVWRRLMRLHYLRGDRAAAVAAFESFEARVCREWGLRPAAETLALLDAVERLPMAAPAVAAPLPPSLLRPPRLVGRNAALAEMAQAWQAGRAVLVLGPAGIGKSRAVEAFLYGREGTVAVAARPGDGAMPYATIGTLLSRLHEAHPAALAAPWRAELARLVAAFGPPPAWPAQEPRLWQAVEAMLAAACGHGLRALALDDLHEADEASIAAVHWLLASPRLAALRWVLAARPADGNGPALVQRMLGDSQRLQAVSLQPLPAESVAEFVAALGLPLPAAADPAFVAALHRHAGGHPFFMLETLKSLLLQGGHGTLPLPRSTAVEALLQHRIDSLSAPAKELLQIVALAGSDLQPEVAARVLGRSWVALAHAWSELQALQLVRDHDTAHGLVRDVVLATLPLPARRALHRALAEEFEARADAPPAQRAAHWLGAEAWAPAARALALAAAQARQAGRLAEHEGLLQQAADAAARAGDEATAFAHRCEALAAHMLRHGAAAVLAPLDDALARATTPARRGRLQALRCEALLNLGRVEAALQAGEAAMADTSAADPSSLGASVLYGRALAMAGQLPRAVAVLAAARRRATTQAGPAPLMQVQAALAHALFSAHRHPQALRAQQQAVALAQRLGDATERAHHEANLAAIAMNVGDVPLAYRAASRAHRRFRTVGIADGHYVVNRVTLARQALHLGRLDHAHRLLAPLLADTGAVGESVAALAHIAHLGLSLVRGDAAAARQAGQALARLEQPSMLPMIRAVALLARLRLAAACGEDSAALRDALQAMGRQHPALLDNPLLLCLWAEWDEPPAMLPRLLAVARDRARQGSPGAARSLELAAVAVLAGGDAEQRAQATRLAIRLARQPQGPWLATVHPPDACWTLAQVLRAAGREAAEGRCLARGRQWLLAARLPAEPDAGEARRRLHAALPAHRALLGVASGDAEARHGLDHTPTTAR